MSQEEIKELEEKIEEAMLEKVKLGNGVEQLREQVNVNLTRMAQLDGKMELLREMIEDKKKDAKISDK